MKNKNLIQESKASRTNFGVGGGVIQRSDISFNKRDVKAKLAPPTLKLNIVSLTKRKNKKDK